MLPIKENKNFISTIREAFHIVPSTDGTPEGGFSANPHLTKDNWSTILDMVSLIKNSVKNNIEFSKIDFSKIDIKYDKKALEKAYEIYEAEEKL